MENNVTNKQFAFIIYCIVVGYGIIDLPKSTAEIGGTGGWVAILISTLMFMVITYIITYLQYEYEGKTLYEYSQQLVGKIITYVLVIIYIIYFFLYFTMIIRIFCETISLTVLPKTPIIYMLITLYIVIYYEIVHGIDVMARLCEIYAFCNIIFSILFGLILFSQGKIVDIRPLFIPQDIGTYFKSISKMINPFLGMEILMVIPVNKSRNNNLPRYTSLMIGFIGSLYIYISLSAISVVGVESIVTTKASIFDIAKGTDIYYLEFLRRLDGIYFLAWTLNIVCAVSLWGYGVIVFVNKCFKNRKYKLMVISVILLSFTVGQLPKSIDEVNKVITYTSYLGIVTSLIIPVTLFFITKVKKHEKKI